MIIIIVIVIIIIIIIIINDIIINIIYLCNVSVFRLICTNIWKKRKKTRWRRKKIHYRIE